MNTTLQKKVFSSLQVYPEQILDEEAIQMVYQKALELITEIVLYEQKYQMNFASFNSQFRQQSAPAELERDWMAWRFAEEGVECWKNLLKELEYIRNYQKTTSQENT